MTQDIQSGPASTTSDPCRMGKDKRLVFDVILGNQRNGVKDMTRHEIRDGYMRLYGKVIERGQISAIVAKLLRDQRLQESAPRICNCCANADKPSTLTTVFIPAEQVRMFT